MTVYEAEHPRTGRLLIQTDRRCLVTEGNMVVVRKRRMVSGTLPSLLIVQAADGTAPQSPFGSLPSDEEVAAWAGTFDWVVVMHHRLFLTHSDGTPNSVWPWMPARPDELLRFNAACLRHDIVSLAYVSPFDSARFGKGVGAAFLDKCRDLLIGYGYRGFYVDGLLFDWGRYELDDPEKSFEVAQALRQMVGPRGVLVGHLSHGNQPAAFMPPVEELFDCVLKGEGAPIRDLGDPYLNHEIATTQWTGVPVGWLYHKYWERLSKNVTLDELMRWQVEHGMMGLSYAQMKEVDGRTTWSDGRTSYYTAWRRAVNDAGATG